jgi:hypothetical protein
MIVFVDLLVKDFNPELLRLETTPEELGGNSRELHSVIEVDQFGSSESRRHLVTAIGAFNATLHLESGVPQLTEGHLCGFVKHLHHFMKIFQERCRQAPIDSQSFQPIETGALKKAPCHVSLVGHSRVQRILNQTGVG